MPRQSAPPQRDDTVAAIERVLRAERDGVETLRLSKERAEQLRADARAQAASIASRADRCISRLHAAYLQKIAGEVRKLEEARPTTTDGEPAYDSDALNAAAQSIAARLTGTS